MKKYGFVLCKVLITTLLFSISDCYAARDVHNMLPNDVLLSYSGSIQSLNLPQDTIPKEKKKKDKSVQNDRTSRKKVTFETFDKNLERAMKFYKNSQYLTAAKLFEELYPLSLGTPQADTILFLFASCYYQNKDYKLAAFHFKNYTKTYPGTDRTEEAYFMCAKSVYNVSPYYSLDQFETKYAIEEINTFVQLYPKSKFMVECNTMLDELQDKLALKDFEILKLYYNTGSYLAAQIAGKNFLRDFSYSKYTPEAMYILVKNNHDFAKKSVSAKQWERYLACIDAYEVLKISYPDSQYVGMAEGIILDANKAIDKISKRNANKSTKNEEH